MLVERPLWILYAEGVLWAQTVRQKILLSLWVLWEKILYEMCKQANRGNLTYYSPLHSERGVGVRSLCALWEKNLSTISPHILLDCRRALTTFQNTPFLHAEHALLGLRRACSWRVLITFWFLVGYRLDKSRCRPLVLRTKIYVLCNAQQEVSKWLS